MGYNPLLPQSSKGGRKGYARAANAGIALPTLYEKPFSQRPHAQHSGYSAVFIRGAAQKPRQERRVFRMLSKNPDRAAFGLLFCGVGGRARGKRSNDSRAIVEGPRTAWIPIADLLDDNVAAPPAVEPAAPEEPAEPTAPTDNAAALAQLQAELDALRGENDALRGDLSAARDSLASRTAIGGGRQVVRDTVIVSHTDTLLFCPPTDQERRDLFDLFTGANDDTTNSEGPAGKTASVQLESWGAIKSLIQE